MKQFEVWRYNFPRRGEHPCVILTRSDLCGSAVINILYCTSQRQSRTAKPYEVFLNGEDGMDWETFVDCSTIFSAETKDVFGRRGQVTHERRNAIRDKIRDIFRLASRD